MPPAPTHIILTTLATCGASLPPYLHVGAGTATDSVTGTAMVSRTITFTLLRQDPEA